MSISKKIMKTYKNRTCSVYRPSHGRITDDIFPSYQVNG